MTQRVNSFSQRMRVIGLLHMGPEKVRLMREGGWVVSTNVVKAVAMVVGLRLMTEVLPRDVFGAANLLMSAAMLGFSVLSYPLLQAVTRLYPDVEQHGAIRPLRMLIIKILMSASLLLAAGGGLWLFVGGASSDFRGRSDMIYLALVSILLLQAFMAVELALLRAARRQKASGLWEAGNATLRPILVVGLVVLLGPSSHVVLWAYAAALAISSLVTLGLRDPWPAVPAVARETANMRSLRREVVVYGLPLVPIVAMSWVLTVSDRYIIAWQLGADATGLYTAAYGLITTPFIMCQGVLSTTLRPLYHIAISQQNQALERKAYMTWLGATVLTSLLGLALTVLLLDLVTRLFLAVEYREAVHFIPWLALGASLQAISQVIESILYGHKRTALLPAGYVFTTAFCLVATILLVRRSGVIGAAWAYCLTYALHCIVFALMSWFFVRRRQLIGAAHVA
jgi:O-antigen/teichoic acid export membrane protein